MFPVYDEDRSERTPTGFSLAIVDLWNRQPFPGVRCATPGFKDEPLSGFHERASSVSAKSRASRSIPSSSGRRLHHLESPVLCVGGVAHHVHILCRLGRSVTIAELIKVLKKESSKWLKTQAAELHDFFWQNGYGVFSVSPSHMKALTTYIQEQEDHHKRISFQDEFRRMLTKYALKWDERYIWD
jgi:hypothetical protein